jgi:tetratricopeptide (TPR) repeat protein
MLAAAVALHAVEPNDRFVRIYTLIQQADALSESGHNDPARQKYLEAQGELESLRKENPGWNESVVEFRLKYVTEKLTPNGKPSAQGLPGTKAAMPSPTSGSPETIQLLQEQIRQLTADKELLQARLKEALTAQPAAVDPRELARAEERIKTLQKQVEVLKASLEKAESKPNKPVDPAVLEDARKALDAVSQKLARQAEMTATATMEKEALQTRLQSFIDGEETRVLRSENDSLKRQATDLTARAEAGTRANELKQQFGLLQAEFANLKARTDGLAAGKKKLEDRLVELAERRDADLAVKTRALEKELSETKTIAQTNAAIVSALQAALKAAQREKDELQKKLNVATNEAHYFKAREPSAQANQLTDRIPVSRAGIDALEAGKTPYSPEELALLKPPDHVLPGTGDGTDKKSSPKLPALVGSLVAEAERAFAARRYEEAEKKYYRALRFDGENAAVLAGLAAAQIKQDRLADAERNLNKALAADPKDAFSLSLLGILKIRADKYDAALDALSQSARLNPQNADTFQYLGVALAGKGLREPAVSAFRRALQLAPNNVDAHHNLAVVYAGQHPPSLELARWHYQKALQAGCPKDPGLERILDANKPAVPSE